MSMLASDIQALRSGACATLASGVVTLTGDVEWQYQRANILKNDEHVSGVVNVVNLVNVKPRAHVSDIQSRIKDALKRHADVEATKVSIAVNNGTVTLTGSVESLEEMDRRGDPVRPYCLVRCVVAGVGAAHQCYAAATIQGIPIQGAGQ